MTILRFTNCELDLDVFELRRAGELISVEPQVFDLLSHLAQRPDQVVTKEELLDEIWGDRFVSESALTSRLKAARRAVGDDGRTQAVIKTVHGRGYRFVAPVDVSTPAAEPSPVPAGPATQPRTARLDIDTSYAVRNGRSTAYQVAGEGERDIVYIPGFVSHIELQWEIPGFADFFERLSAMGRFIIFDKPGTGLSDRLAPDETPPLEERIADAIGVMDAAGSSRATLVGVSEGAAMAVMMAALHPDRVAALVLVNSFPNDAHIPDDRLDDFLEWLERVWGEGKVYTQFLAPTWADDPTMVRLCARYERNAASPAAAARFLGLNARSTDVCDILGAVQAPTLVLHREDDPVVPIERGRVLAEGIPGAEFRVLPGSDHLVFAGNLDDIMAPIESFIVGPDAAPRPLERVLKTVMFADIVASTETAVAMGDHRWTDLLERFHARSAEITRRHDGELTKTIGDETLSIFTGPAGAVRAGLELVQSVAPLGLTLRVGVHTAEIELLDDDVAGIGVHIGARVTALAEPGEVWVSRTVYDLVAGSGLRFTDRGVHELKGVDRSWELYSADS